MGPELQSSDITVPGQGIKKKILLVDDVKLFIELEKTFFQRKAAFEVLTAGSGREALEIVQAEQPDLVFMDLYMPEMNGDECCRIIRANDSGNNIPVIIVTSAGKEEDRERCLAAGCTEIVTKPINRAHFLSVAKKYLEIHARKEPRYAVHVKVLCIEEMEMELTDYTVNLNTGGLFLASSRQPPVDTRLSLEFSLPESDASIACQARIAWINESEKPLKRDLPAGMGLQFVDITTEDVTIIREYINSKELTADW